MLSRLCLAFFALLVHSVADEDVFHNHFAVHVPGGRATADEVAARHGFFNRGQIGDLEGYFLFEHSHVHRRSTSHSATHHEHLAEEPEVRWFEQQKELKRVKRDVKFLVPHDPMFQAQWFLNHGAKDGSDMNVQGAWKLGYTGKGVAVSILDDGIQTNHPDLKQNYDPKASTDINGNDDDPMPRDNGDNKHGTRCAGEVAAVAFNDYCGVGIAYNSSIGGVRMLDGIVNDAVEARALSLNPDHIDIYSASWGPEDDGRTVDGPGPLAKKAFVNGIEKGRKGKGSIFVWASGNGGRKTDNCNCDGYTNSIYTLSISSATQGGFKPWYLEQCSSTLATTYSSGTPSHDKSIVTVDQDGKLRPGHICTDSHTGTSASAPIAAGVCALALEANPNLTWRDMQHIVVMTANPHPLLHESGWAENGVGRKYSHKFGYGLMDATAMVEMARDWRGSGEQLKCESLVQTPGIAIPKDPNHGAKAVMNIDGRCDQSRIRFLEHVQCKISLHYNPRGALQIVLKSPMGTESSLLLPRPKDKTEAGFEDWAFLSVHFWGENPDGAWTLDVFRSPDIPANGKTGGVLKKWSLVFYGTESNPLSEHDGIQYSGYDEDEDEHTTFIISGEEEDTSANYIDDNLSKSNYPGSFFTDHDGCHRECLNGCSAAGPQYCKDCRNYKSQHTCVHDCPAGTYATGEMICRKCNSACGTCFGPRSDQCLTCKNPSHFYVSDQGRCYSQRCPLGYRLENLEMNPALPQQTHCIPCPQNCQNCTTSPQTHAEICLGCSDGLVLHEGKCVAVCPAGHYINNQTQECSACHSSCSTCIGGLATQCAQCQQGTFYFERNCVAECPKGFFQDARLLECIPCPKGCVQCDSRGNCLQCETDWRLVALTGKCAPVLNDRCRPGEFFDKLGNCSQCAADCPSCQGKSLCLSCTASHLLHIQDCVDACPSGTYQIGSNCQHCPHTCRKCKDSTFCSTCQPGYFLFEQSCLPTCPDGFYPSPDGVCQPCHSSCRTCSGLDVNQCLTCQPGILLSGGACGVKCTAGTYLALGAWCRACHASCLDCSKEGPDHCVSCKPGLKPVETEEGVLRCLPCQPGHFFADGHCNKCHASCGDCSGPFPTDCTSCKPPLKLDSWNRTCVPCCKGTQTADCCPCNASKTQCQQQPDRSAKKRSSFRPNNLHVIESFGPSPAPSAGGRMFLLVCVMSTVAVGGFMLMRNWKRSRRRRSRPYARDSHKKVTYQKIPQNGNGAASDGYASPSYRHGGRTLFEDEEDVYFHDEDEDVRRHLVPT